MQVRVKVSVKVWVKLKVRQGVLAGVLGTHYRRRAAGEKDEVGCDVLR